MKIMRSTIVPALALGLIVASGCTDSTGIADPSAVALSFRVVGLASPAAVAPSPNGPSRVSHPTLTIDGTNGSLRIDEIRLIVAEAELEPEDDDSCDDLLGSSSDNHCPDFEAPPRFLNLRLDGEPVDAMVGMIPPNTYDELEFEVEDLEDDEEDPQLAAQIEALLNDIRAEFPDWPRKASALVVGAFIDNDGATTEFRVYLEAEIEVEMELVPSLVIGEDGSASRSLTVDVQPHIWFLRPDGSVLPLHLYDFDTTGETRELELEMENGFTHIEIG